MPDPQIPGRLMFELSPEQMRSLAEQAKKIVLYRILDAINVNDAPAKPLTPRYAKRKAKKGGRPTRDLYLSGEMLGSVESEISEEKIYHPIINNFKIGFLDDAMALRMQYNEKLEDMWGFSPKDTVAIMDIAERMFEANLDAVADTLARAARPDVRLPF